MGETNRRFEGCSCWLNVDLQYLKHGWPPFTERDVNEHFDVYTTLWYYYSVVFIESAAFSRRLRALAGSEEASILRGIQNDLIQSPARAT